MRKTSPRVLLALGWYDHRLHRGIERYALEHGWWLQGDIARERTIPWGWDGDGILAWLSADEELSDYVVCARKPTVDFSFHRPHLKFARVLEDNEGAARLVASHFLSRGLRQFLFYTDADNWVQHERGNGFQQALACAGHRVRWLDWLDSPTACSQRNTWQAKRKWLAGKLERTARPVGVFAATDTLAYEVVEACDVARLRVPDEVAVVGAGNSLLAVDTMATPISSVDTNLEALGYRGAQQLDRLLRRRQVPASSIRVPPSRLIVRRSSDLTAVSNPGIARGLRFLLDHYHESIRVEDLARAAAMSVRNFHALFVRHLGRTPGAEINRVRVEKAKQLLTASDQKLAAIAEECGYQSGNSLWVAIKKDTGVSPRRYQAQHNISMTPGAISGR